jgi:hypothetical protein
MKTQQHFALFGIVFLISTTILLSSSCKLSRPLLTLEQQIQLEKIFHKYQNFFVSQNEMDVLLHQWAEETPCERHQLCDFRNDLFCANVCRIGTVQISPILANTLSFQQYLQRDHPLNFVVFPSPHNSAISKAYGYGN